ncbi:MAG: hypothetical protein ABS944_14470 [Solibacillus sp.]
MVQLILAKSHGLIHQLTMKSGDSTIMQYNGTFVCIFGGDYIW